MRFFRNPEIFRASAALTVLTITATLLSLTLSRRYALYTFTLCVALSAVFLLATHARYKKIYLLSTDIDKMLHGENTIRLDDYTEGELSVLQTELQKMTTRLIEQSEKLQSDKNYLANSLADISHQLRTPLTSMNLIASFLADERLPAKRRMELIGEMRTMLAQIDRLVSSLLKMSRLDAGSVSFKAETITIKELLNKSCAPLLISIELREQSLNIVKAEGSFTGDVGWTREAIGNILKNCMEHTPSGGVLELSAVETALYSEIIISDNGTGIDPDDLPHIFERFYRGKNASPQSIGIGLALARTVITSQGGTVKAENRKQGGAKFTIRFYKQFNNPQNSLL